MSTIDLTEETFEAMVQQKGIVLIDRWALWCGPCRAFAPVFEKVAEAHPEATFAKVDTQAEPGLASAFEVHAIPTLSILRDGVMLFHRAGMLTRGALEDLLRQASALDMNAVNEEILAKNGAVGGV
jgi:thioredoxin 1